MNEIAIFNSQLPATPEELSTRIIVGTERLNAIRAAIRAADRVGAAKEIRDEMVKEAIEINDGVIDAETRLGDLTRQMPKKSGGDHGNQYTGGKIRGGSNFGKPDPDAWYKDLPEDVAEELDERLATKEANRTVTKREQLEALNISKDQVSDYGRIYH